MSTKLKAPSGASGDYCCTGWRQSGRVYKLTPGATIDVDDRDVQSLMAKGFWPVADQKEEQQ
jgi:hypothetical protein